MPNPYPHKEIPLIKYGDHYVSSSQYYLGEYDITRNSRAAKDEVRSLMMDGTRAGFGVITIDESSDFDENTFKLGIREIMRVDKDAVGHFAPNVNLQALQLLESNADNDMIVDTGVDFKSQLIAPSETATRTSGKIDASRKRINQNIKMNAFSFYSRLARLRLANMKTFYKSARVISTPSEDYAGSTKQALNGGYGTFIMKPEYRLGNYNIIPVIDSLFGDTTEEKKNAFIQFMQLFAPLVKSDTGKAVISGEQWIESARGIFGDIVDIDKLLATKPEQQSPENIMKDLEAQMNGTPEGSSPMDTS